MASAVIAGVTALRSWPGDRALAWIPDGTPAAVATALAIEASGHRSVPLERDARGAVAVPVAVKEAVGDAGLALVVTLDTEAPGDVPADCQVLEIPAVPTKPGGVPSRLDRPRLEEGDVGALASEGPLDFVSQEELFRASEALVRHLEPPRRRDILMSPPAMGSLASRRILSVSVLLGAALALESSEEIWPVALRWVRPTILMGSPQRLRRGARALGTPRWRRSFRPWGPARRLRPPFDRLRAVVSMGDGPFGDAPLSSEDRSYWSPLGVQLPPEPGEVR